MKWTRQLHEYRGYYRLRIFRKTGCFDISEELQRSKLIHNGIEISLMTFEFY